MPENLRGGLLFSDSPCSLYISTKSQNIDMRDTATCLYTGLDLLHDVPDVTVPAQRHQSIGHRLLVNERVDVIAKECIRNPDPVPLEDADAFIFRASKS